MESSYSVNLSISPDDRTITVKRNQNNKNELIYNSARYVKELIVWRNGSAYP